MTPTDKGQHYLDELRRAIALDLAEKQQAVMKGISTTRSLPATRRAELLALAEQMMRTDHVSRHGKH